MATTITTEKGTGLVVDLKKCKEAVEDFFDGQGKKLQYPSYFLKDHGPLS